MYSSHIAQRKKPPPIEPPEKPLAGCAGILYATAFALVLWTVAVLIVW